MPGLCIHGPWYLTNSYRYCSGPAQPRFVPAPALGMKSTAPRTGYGDGFLEAASGVGGPIVIGMAAALTLAPFAYVGGRAAYRYMFPARSAEPLPPLSASQPFLPVMPASSAV
jgi:hypothetical protein